MKGAVDVVVFLAGAALVLATLTSAARTMVLPRAVPAKLASTVFVGVLGLYKLRLGRAASYERRDQVMASYATLSLLVLALCWLALVFCGYTAMFWALGEGTLREDMIASGSSLLTLGFEAPDTLATAALSFSAAIIGLSLVALLITYLPSLYSAFSRRETLVAMLRVRAGSPPSGVEMIERFASIGWIGGLEELWRQWETWFVEVEETHTSYPALVYFRSPEGEQSWLTAGGAVLDAAALVSSTLEDHDPDAELCLRAGFLALRRIADVFGVPHDPDPRPTDPISIARDEYDVAYDRLAAAGVRLRPDRDQAWRDFAGWRVNYDQALVTLAGLVMAPYAPWSSDRSVIPFRVSVRRTVRRRRQVPLQVGQR